MSKAEHVRRSKSKSLPKTERLAEEIKVLSRFPAENPNPVMRMSKDGMILYCNDAGSPILNEWKCQVGQPAPSSWCGLVADVFKSGTKKEFEEEYGTRTFLFVLAPIVEAGYVNVYGQDISERKQTERELRKARYELEIHVEERTRELREASAKLQAEIGERKKAHMEVQIRADQQAVVAQLGQMALGGCDLDELFNEAVKQVAQTLNVEYCKVLELLPGERELLLRAGVGWKEGFVGRATVGTGTDSQAGYTLLSDEPVIVEDLKTEKRFSGPPLLHEHKVVSGMSVIISGHDKPFGVLGAHTTRRLTFTKDDVNFLQAVANVLATTIEHKRAEEAVKAERKRFTDVLEMLPAYLVLLTPDYHVSYANRFFRERFGEDHGRHCFEYLFGRTEPCPTCETYKTLKTMAPLEWEWTGPDGRNYYIFDAPFTDVDGSTLILEVGIDITERKKAEEALRRAHDELEVRVQERTKDLRQATEGLQAEITERKKAEQALRESQIDLNRAQAVAKVGSWRLNVRRNELLWSDETHRMFGIPKGASMTYETFLDTVHPDDREYVDQKWQAALRGESYDIEHRTVVDGEVKWMREKAELEFDRDGLLLGGFGTVQDITERKRMERELFDTLEASQRRQSEVSALLKASRAVLQNREFHASARAIFDSCKELLGATAGYVALLSDDGKNNVVLFLDSGGLPCTVDTSLPMPIRGLRAEAYRTGKAIYHNDFPNSEWAKLMPKGHMILKNVLFAPLIIDKKTVGLIGIANKLGGFTEHDAQMALAFGELASIALINSRNLESLEDNQKRLKEYSQHLEEMVEERTKKLQDAQRLATIGETAGMVGHDIRNPLQSIEGAVYLAKDELKSLPAESQERKELNEILEIIEHQATYIDHIVADLQDFSRTPMPQPRETDIQELTVESLSMIEIPEDIQVGTVFQENLPKSNVDPVFIKRVLVNLIENAVQAMPNGGKLTLKVFCDEESTCICVEDTGVGIPEEHKAKMFTPLFSTKAKGQGFGLSVCKKLVEAHSGEITFESETGKGSTFTIKLPFKKKAN